MQLERLDAFLLVHRPNIYYLCGFTGTAGALLIGPRGVLLFTDSRYTLQARDEVEGAWVRVERKSLLAAAGREMARQRARRVGFEAARLTVARMEELKPAAGSRVRWVGWDGQVENLRSVKSDAEIAVMRQAADIACACLEETFPLVKPGVREAELAAELEYRFRLRGAEGPAFETIVASGPRSALPHARASNKTLGKNELVVFDLGAILRGYSSDLTRTVFLGRAPVRVRQWYRAVVEAQHAARDALRPGVKAETVDAAARQVLRKAGLAGQFVHSTGHGLGLEVHEVPRLGRGDRTPLNAGNVVTIEPGIYVEGVGGIRIEDDAVVRPGGAEVITRTSQEFFEL